MARRTRTESDNSTTSTDTLEAPISEATATPSEEDSSMTVTTESEATVETTPEVPAEQAPEVPAEKPAPVAEVDLTGFTSKVDEAVAGRDETTGEVPEALIAAAQTEYRAIDGVKGKNAAKKLVEERMREAMNARDISSARAYMLVSDNLTAGASGSKAEKVPADPKEAFVQRFNALSLALALVAQDRPEGIEDERLDVNSLIPAAQALQAYEASEAEDKGDAPEASAVVKAAVKLAIGKAARVGATRQASTFTGERRDIGQHIREAFESVEPGTFLTVAEIRKFESSQYQAASPASAGAISARLFPTSGKCTVEGVEPGQNEKGNKGATKVA